MIRHVTYTDKNMTTSALHCAESATKHGCDTSCIYTERQLSETFRARNASILSEPRGAGYWIWKYFLHCKDLIRHYFEFSEDCEAIPEEAIAIHIRRGDYDDSYHPTMKEKYYKQSLDLLPNVPKFVFSDDIKEAKKLIGNDATYIEGNHYIKDLQLMTKCKHFVLSNSTFCWWGWWLADHGKCIAPQNWFGDVAMLSSKDIYTDEMIII